MWHKFINSSAEPDIIFLAGGFKAIPKIFVISTNHSFCMVEKQSEIRTRTPQKKKSAMFSVNSRLVIRANHTHKGLTRLRAAFFWGSLNGIPGIPQGGNYRVYAQPQTNWITGILNMDPVVSVLNIDPISKYIFRTISKYISEQNQTNWTSSVLFRRCFKSWISPKSKTWVHGDDSKLTRKSMPKNIYRTLAVVQCGKRRAVLDDLTLEIGNSFC